THDGLGLDLERGIPAYGIALDEPRFQDVRVPAWIVANVGNEGEGVGGGASDRCRSDCCKHGHSSSACAYLTLLRVKPPWWVARRVMETAGSSHLASSAANPCET